jgi:protein-S-isoprenylcysteine O-methyltransferase Ste14
MSSHNHAGIIPEHPYSHEIQLGSVIVFAITWILDTFALHLGEEFKESIWIVFQVVLFILLAGIAYLLVNASHGKIFGEQSGKAVVDDGIYFYIRHPMYISIIVLLSAFFVLSLSFLSLIPLIGAILAFDRMMAFEEKELVRILGDPYQTYMKKVPRWFPRPSRFYRKKR